MKKGQKRCTICTVLLEPGEYTRIGERFYCPNCANNEDISEDFNDDE